MHKSIDGTIIYSEQSSLPTSTMQVSEIMRGRTRHRSHVRSTVKVERPDESSTLRGRSRERASSPRGPTSRNHSPSLMSPSRHLAISNRLRDSRREHCPSRATSPSGRKDSLRRGRGTRGRSTSRGRRTEGHRAVDSQSGLRHEVFAEDTTTVNNEGPHEEERL